MSSSNVSLDDIQKRMKRLELSLNAEKNDPRQALGLPIGHFGNEQQPKRPSTAMEFPKKTHVRNSSMGSLGLSFTQTRPSSAQPLTTPPGLELSGLSRQNRPSSGLDLTNSGPNSPAMQRKKKLPFNYIHPEPDAKSNESVEVNKRLQEAFSQNGKLRIDGRLFNSKASDFENLGEIGAGTCGQVYKMRFKHANRIMAVKQMHRSGNNEENKRILMDLDVVQKSNFPHIVTCFGTLITESHVWICMELMSTCFDKLLKKIKGPIPEKVIGKLCIAVVRALNYLKEQHGVIHRDVKPSNILIDKRGTVKLCDFGISGRLVDSKAKTRTAGCVAYMAPERIDPPDPTSPDYDIRADVWSLGVSLVELATGRFPYPNCTTDFEVLTKVLQNAPPMLPQNANFSMPFRQFVKLCCTKNFQQRPKYRQLLEHDFIKHSERITVDITEWLTGVLNFPTTPSFSDPFLLNNFTPLPTNDAFNPVTSQPTAQANRLGNGVNFTISPQQNNSNVRSGWESFDDS
uniref:dual specificity mitogen-activated protein kinase kinase 7-like n=1 Tax=Styela clava TaxID=7725 RepID=UPI00193A5019|nr:dual specificity mitogen-activated protein kinase kinase 7-like [Styela clava]